MYKVERSTKQKKTDTAAANSRNHMNGMYDYKSVDSRVYQTEKPVPSSESRYTRILPQDVLRHRTDLTVTAQNIRKAELYLDENIPRTPMKEVPEKYGLKYDAEELTTYGDSREVFQMLCDTYPMAKNYRSWGDLWQCIKDRAPIRTEPIRIIRPAQEKKVLPVNEVKPKYIKGDLLWIVYRKDGVPAVAKVNVVSWYTKRLSEGTFDIMYELNGIGGKSVWRLQGSGKLFEKEEDALAFIRKENA